MRRQWRRANEGAANRRQREQNTRGVRVERLHRRAVMMMMMMMMMIVAVVAIIATLPFVSMVGEDSGDVADGNRRHVIGVVAASVTATSCLEGAREAKRTAKRGGAVGPELLLLLLLLWRRRCEGKDRGRGKDLIRGSSSIVYPFAGCEGQRKRVLLLLRRKFDRSARRHHNNVPRFSCENKGPF